MNTLLGILACFDYSSIYLSLGLMSCLTIGRRIWLWSLQIEQRMMNWCLFILAIVCGKREVMYVFCFIFIFSFFRISPMLCLYASYFNIAIQIVAAHICYLVAEANIEPYSDSARLCLVGADHWKFPRTYASPEAIQVLFICLS